MPVEPSMVPDGGGLKAGGGRGYSGTAGGGDPTTEPGQYPPSAENNIFGGPLPTGTGAPGTRGGGPSPDPTNMAGQVDDGLTGISEAQITETGAPGTGTTANTAGGGTSITYTRAGSPYSGTYKSDTTGDNLSGPTDSTMANDEGYATGGPQLPGIAGNEPQAGGSRYQPGAGRVLRGGRAVNP